MNYSYSLISFKLLKLPNYLEGAPATDIGKSATSPSAHLVLNLPEFSHTSPTSLFGSGGFGFAYKKISRVQAGGCCVQQSTFALSVSHTHTSFESQRELLVLLLFNDQEHRLEQLVFCFSATVCGLGFVRVVDLCIFIVCVNQIRIGSSPHTSILLTFFNHLCFSTGNPLLHVSNGVCW